MPRNWPYFVFTTLVLYFILCMLVADANGAHHVKNAISNKYKCLFKYVVPLVVPVPEPEPVPGQVTVLPVVDNVGVVQRPTLLVRCGLLILLIRWFAISAVNVFAGAMVLRCWFHAIDGTVAVVVVVVPGTVSVVVIIVAYACVATSHGPDVIDNNVSPDNGSFGIDVGGNVSTTFFTIEEELIE